MVTPTLQGGKYTACLCIERGNPFIILLLCCVRVYTASNGKIEKEEKRKNNKTQEGLLFCSFTSVTQGSGMLVCYTHSLSLDGSTRTMHVDGSNIQAFFFVEKYVSVTNRLSRAQRHRRVKFSAMVGAHLPHLSSLILFLIRHR